MSTKIIIGSILVIVLFLLMPSIPAIQTNIIKEDIKQDIQERLDEITIEDLMDIEELEWIRHPILYAIVLLLFNLQGLRFVFWFIMAFVVFADVVEGPQGIPHFEPTHPILCYICFVRAALLLLAGWTWADFLNDTSDMFGWNWDIPYP